MLVSTLRSGFRYSNATRKEIRTRSQADILMPKAADRWVRCITINAPHTVVYRWLCQLTVAPYSFDFIDYRGKHSPEELTPGAEHLSIGQKFLIFDIAAFEENVFISGITKPEWEPKYGRIAASYTVRPLSPNVTRLQANACLNDSLPKSRRFLIAFADAIMAGRQLYRLRDLAEKTYREQ